jgi:hypothetical protein
LSHALEPGKFSDGMLEYCVGRIGISSQLFMPLSTGVIDIEIFLGELVDIIPVPFLITDTGSEFITPGAGVRSRRYD